MSISVKGVSKSYGRKVVLDAVSVEAPTGSLLALVGPIRFGKNNAAAHHCRFGSARHRLGSLSR